MRRLPAILALLIAAPLGAQELATHYTSKEVAPGVHMLTGVGGFGGGNVSLLVGDERIVLVDDTMVPTAAALLETANAVAGRPIDFVINTHVHGDHIGGNALLADGGSIVVAHDNIRRRLEENSRDAGGDGGLPVLTFADQVTLHLNGKTARVFHLARAHTDGDAAIQLVDANVIIAGDVHFHKLFPFIDLDSGGTVAGFAAAQQRLLDLADDDTLIIPGHGNVATRADLERDLDVLLDCEARVRELVDEGLDADAIVARNPLAGYHDDYDWSFITTERMTRTLYRSLTAD